ncbi:MAG: hypothetical protein IT361_06715 [Gemmatimonadaceae bacterium]|nr:hypothetical protein [Gemmatimonadaceae bacterium]
MIRWSGVRTLPLLVVLAAACADEDANTLSPTPPESGVLTDAQVDGALSRVLASHGFSGRISERLTQRLGRPLNTALSDVGRLLFFDPLLGLNNDNSCAGCHAPQHGFGDSQSIAIGIQNNGMVGPGRTGPRNQRRTPHLLNAAFYPALMWNSRFLARSGNPFDNSSSFVFPDPEGTSLSGLPHLLTAQAFIPPTERVEMAGFDFVGDNDAIRAEVTRRINQVSDYKARFGQVYETVRAGQNITYEHVGHAIAEFTFSLNFANAPIDQFARGSTGAMSLAQKRGALLFFGKAGCVGCHAVAGQSNEMFSDFRPHVVAWPQVMPANANVTYDGDGANEDFGLEQVTRNPSDRYAFRTSPLRNISLQSAFGHNGAYTRLEDAIRHHLDATRWAASYSPATAGVAADLRGPMPPSQPVIDRLDARLRTPIALSTEEFQQLVEFVRTGLLDPKSAPAELRKLIPATLPSGKTPHTFQP